jgi:hypothetical protein
MNNNNKILNITKAYFDKGRLFFYFKAVMEYILYRLRSSESDMKPGWKRDIATSRLDNKAALRKVKFSSSTFKEKKYQVSEMLEEDIYPLS